MGGPGSGRKKGVAGRGGAGAGEVVYGGTAGGAMGGRDRGVTDELAQLDADRKAYSRMAAAARARGSLLDFMKLTKPDPEDVEDAGRSQYEETPLARLLCEILEKVERGELLRVCVSVGPQFGKSAVISRGFPAWFIGRNPHKNFMLGSYNQDFADEFGGDVREIATSFQYRQVFPQFEFKKGSAAKDSLITMAGGKMAFVGRGASGTGKPADCLPGNTMIETVAGVMRLDALVALPAGQWPLVASYDHEAREVVWRAVVAAASRTAGDVYEFVTESGAVLRATGNHRIYAQGVGYVPASELEVGDRMLLRGSTEVVEDAIAEIRREYQSGGMVVYDLQVEGTECFFANGLLVHNCFICDDALKDDKEAQSPTTRKDLWNWFTKVVFTRCHVGSAVVILNTRWSEDDLIGRLCDKTHPDHDPEIAKNWVYINLPAVVKDEALGAALGLKLERPTDPEVIAQFGDVPMASLWEARKPLRFLAEARRIDPKGFEALYMGNPTPDEGDYFKRADLVGYKPEELPNNLMKYCASDHAISETSSSDKSCFVTAGVDEHGIIWILPDIYWEKEEDSNTIVEVMLDMMRRHKPLIWWAERENISKSILPFLRKRMIEENVMQTLIDDSIVPHSKKRVRAKSMQGMMNLKRVRFPTFAHWWPEAQNELLKFDNGAHDDLVDALSWIGLGLLREVPAYKQAPVDDKIVRVGSIQWIKGRSRYEERQAARLKALKGM